MKLVHFHAFAVLPTKWDEEFELAGGRIPVDGKLEDLVQKNIKRANFDQCLETIFDTDDERHNEMRELIRTHAFGADGQADNAANGIAKKLCVAMDHRSNPALLLIVTEKDDKKSQTTLWTFPRDEALRLVSERRSSALELLSDVFSQSSRLRKAAYYAG